MSNIVVTGANGFVGLALTKELIERGYEVCAIVSEKSDSTELDTLGAACRIFRCDMADYSELPSRLPSATYDACIHLAWAGTAGTARADWQLQLSDASHSCDLVAAMASMGTPRFIGVGTLAELDVLAFSPKDGSTPNAVSIYGAAKIATHLMTKAVCADLGVEHLWCRLVNVYGPGNRTGNFVDMASRRFLGGERASFTEGLQPYDFIYIDDVARALADVMKEGHAGCTYLLGTGEPHPLRDYVCMVRDAAAPDAEIHFGEVPFNGNALPSESYDASKLREHTGFVPRMSFKDGIAETVRWLKENA